MPTTKFCTEEFEALHGRSWLAQLIYMRALRPYMDYKSGLIGAVRAVSLRSIAEECDRYRIAGRHFDNAGKPSQKQVRIALDELERPYFFEGGDMSPPLLTRINAPRRMIWRVTIAPYDSKPPPPKTSAEKSMGKGGAKDGHKSSGTRKASDSAGFEGSSGTPKEEENSGFEARIGKHPGSEGTKQGEPGNSPGKTTIDVEYQPGEKVRATAHMRALPNPKDPDNLTEFVMQKRSAGFMSADWDAEYIAWLMWKKRQNTDRGRLGTGRRVSPKNKPHGPISREEWAEWGNSIGKGPRGGEGWEAYLVRIRQEWDRRERKRKENA